ncbi:MAG: HEAT repeat domain-containing protein [Candidatus Dormibacterales bacterium]
MRHPQIAVRKATIRRSLQAAVAGESQILAIDLDEPGVDVAELICEVSAELKPGSPAVERLVAAFERAGISDKVVDRLAATDPALQARSAEIVGALRLEQAVPWLAPLLAVRDRTVREAAARALGRIGGGRSADALMCAIERSGLSRILIVELARAAPDLFLESALNHAPRAGVRSAAAAAAGLRRRRSAVGPLTALLASGSRSERAMSCRALGWIGAWSARPAITAALEDKESNVRRSAEKALIAILACAPVVGGTTTHPQDGS